MSLTSSNSIHVGRIVPRTDAEGPGTRFAVWVQGCSIRCKGCFNPHFWIADGGITYSPEQLAEKVVNAGVEGITFLGGEPFEQAQPLGTLAKLVQAAGMSVMTFTGYTLEHLQRRAEEAEAIQDLLDATDLLVDGPFIQNRIDNTRPWIGSSNQRFHFLTNRYSHLKNCLSDQTDRIEIRVGADGSVNLNGWSSPQQLESLIDLLENDLDIK